MTCSFLKVSSKIALHVGLRYTSESAAGGKWVKMEQSAIKHPSVHKYPRSEVGLLAVSCFFPPTTFIYRTVQGCPV